MYVCQEHSLLLPGVPEVIRTYLGARPDFEHLWPRVFAEVVLCASKIHIHLRKLLNLPRGTACLAAAQKPHWFMSLVTGEEKAEQRGLLTNFGKLHWLE